MKQKDGYWIDNENNAWNAQWYSKADAIVQSRSLQHCNDCVNCKACIHCSGCTNCNECAYCYGCVYCNNCDCCSRAKSCSACHYCVHCSYCKACAHNENCTGVIGSDHAENQTSTEMSVMSMLNSTVNINLAVIQYKSAGRLSLCDAPDACL